MASGPAVIDRSLLSNQHARSGGFLYLTEDKADKESKMGGK